MKANQLFICSLFILLTASCGSRSGNEFEGVWVGYIPGYTLEYDDTEPAYIPEMYRIFVIEDNVIRYYSMSTRPTSLKEIRGLGEPDEWSKGSYIIEGNTLYKETPFNFQLTKEGDVLYDDTIWDDSPTHVKLEKAFSFSKAESKRKDEIENNKEESLWAKSFDEHNVLVLDTQLRLSREGENEFFIFLHAAPYSEDKTEGKYTLSHWKRLSETSSRLFPMVVGDYKYYNGQLYVSHCKAAEFLKGQGTFRWKMLENQDEMTFLVNEEDMSITGKMIILRDPLFPMPGYVESSANILAIKSDFNYSKWLNSDYHPVF